jgi:titin
VNGLTDGTTYYFTVEAINAIGSSAPSNEASVIPMSGATVPGVPTGLTASPGDTEATLEWTTPASDGGSPIIGYNVYEGTSSGGESTTPINSSPLPATATSYLAIGLTNGTPYYFTVEAINAVGSGAPSNEASATPTSSETVPGVPTGLTASPGDTAVTLNWTAPISDGGSQLTGYNIFEGTSSGGESTTPVNSSPLPATAISYLATGLTNGTTYYFTVVAINAVGSSVPSNEASATPTSSPTLPGAPTALAASPGDTAITLNWTAPVSDGGSPILGYNVFEGTSPGGESTAPVNSSLLAATASNYVVTGLTNGVTYYFKVEAVNAIGSSAPSNEASATPTSSATVPDAPTVLVASPGDTAVTLNWTAPVSDGGSPIIGYNVFEGTSPGGESTTPVNGSLLPATVSSYIVTGLTNGVIYYFTVEAVNAIGNSAPSDEASATPTSSVTTPGAPLALMATPGRRQITLSWTAPTSDGGTPILGYNVYMGKTSGGESTKPINASLLPSTSYLVTGLKNGKTYYFIVKAANAVGVGAASNQSSVAPGGTPGMPQQVMAKPGNKMITLSWIPPTYIRGRAIIGYNVYEGTSPGGESTTPINKSPLSANARRYVVKGLKNGRRYFFFMKAINAFGMGNPSAQVSAIPSLKPSSPRYLTATPGNTQITLHWMNPRWNGESPITGYNVYEGTSPGKESSKPVNRSLLLAGARSYIVKGLTNGKTYYFIVKAMNAVGIGRQSRQVSAVPSRSAVLTRAINLSGQAATRRLD